MVDRLHLVLPLVPSVNSMYMTTKYGGRVRTKKARDWFDEAERITKLAIVEQGWQPTIGEKVVLEIMTYFPDRRKRDVNNSSKALCDMLEHARVYDNDRYALPRYIDYAIDREHPRTEVVVRKFGEGDEWKTMIPHA